MMIDIIIPAYHSQKTIIATLCSIASQTLSNQALITIVNASPDGDNYEDVIRSFSFLNIQEVANPGKRLYPGEARNLGKAVTKNPYIVFMDADDIYYSAYSLELLYNRLHSDSAIIAVEGMLYDSIKHECMVESHASTGNIMYKRSFIQHIDFLNILISEDMIFKDELSAMQDDQHRIMHIKQPVTIYQYRDDSVTHSEEGKSRMLSDTLTGINYLYAKLPDDKKQKFVISKLFLIYSMYIKCKDRCPELLNNTMRECLKALPDMNETQIISAVISAFGSCDEKSFEILMFSNESFREWLRKFMN